MKRRNFIKLYGLSIALLPTMSFSQVKATAQKLQDISLCNFCAVGCNDNITKNYCIKGESQNTINSCERIKQPLLRMANNQFKAISWEEAFNIMSEKAKTAIKNKGPNGVGVITSGNLGIIESYSLMKLFRAGFRSNNIFNTNQYTAFNSMVASTQVFGESGIYGNFEDISKSDIVVNWGSNLAETYPVFFNEIKKQNKKTKFEFINISTFENMTAQEATVNLIIKADSDEYLLKFLINNYLKKNLKSLNWDILKKRFIFAKINSDNFIKLDELEQWEISFKNFLKSYEKYTLEYIAPFVKIDSESLKDFTNKLDKVSLFFNDNKLNISSIWSSAINRAKNGVDLNILIYTLHLLTNKYSRPGCAMLSLTGQANSLINSVLLGNFTHRLPANMYIKYKEHRSKCEAIWRIPEETINPEATPDQFSLINNLKNNITDFIWIMGSNPCKSIGSFKNTVEEFKENEDSFIVTSDYFMSETCYQSDLILPTAMLEEKETITSNNNKNLHLTKQKKIPLNQSMSELWQISEFSKFIELKDVWNINKIDDNTLIVNVLFDIFKYGYDPKNTLFAILFGNERAKRYVPNKSDLNSEAWSDKRKVITKDGFLFFGYKFHLQKYLYEEMRSFFAGVAYDFPSYEQLQEHDLKWPYLFKKEILYKFNTMNDFYAKKASMNSDNYIFYGTMGAKTISYGNLNAITSKVREELKYRAKLFVTNEHKPETNDLFYLFHIKVLEHVNTGNITRNIEKLTNINSTAYCYMSKIDMQRLKINDFDKIRLYTKTDSLIVQVLYDKRYNVNKNQIAIANFDVNVNINSILSPTLNSYVSLEKVI